MYHVSVTGMELISFWHLPTFMGFASRSMTQAKEAAGVVKVTGTYRKGIHHTLTLWESKDFMQQYLRSGSHKEAVAQSKNIGSFVKVLGYDSDEIPELEDALRLWQDKGRVVYNIRRSKGTSAAVRTGTFSSFFLLSIVGITLFAVLFTSMKVLPAGESLKIEG